MDFQKCNHNFRLLSRIFFYMVIVLLLIPEGVKAQNVAHVMLGQFWTGVVDNGSNSNWTPPIFFPNDYNIMFNRLQYRQATSASGISIAATHFVDQYANAPGIDSTKYPVLDTGAVFDLIGSDYPAPFNNGVIVSPMSSLVRYIYTPITFDNTGANIIKDDATQYYQYFNMKNTTADQVIDVTNKYIYDITLRRHVLSWGQNFNDNYVIYDLEFTNVGGQTYDSLYILLDQNMYNMQFSNGQNPQPASSNQFQNTYTWLHYHGGRASDTSTTFCDGAVPGKLRVYYEYSADDPDKGGDQMGAPAEPAQEGRLTGALMDFISVLHASKEAYDTTNPGADTDDFLQPRVTYPGNDTKISSSYQSGSDQYGSASFWAIIGGFSNNNPMSGDTFSGTHHGLNPDELGVTNFFEYAGGSKSSNQALMHLAFGPYHMSPGQRIHIVYASGAAGIGEKLAKKVGAEWLNKTISDPPNEPNNNTGWLPSNFEFPQGATQWDISKDKWVSMGIDSVMLAAYRAKWNFDHNYMIPQDPPPPAKIEATASANHIEINWTDPQAEQMSNFAGYRIMRRISRYDTVFYEPVYNSDANDKAASSKDEHTFLDTTIRSGANYSYYVQAKALIDPNEPNADPTTRGKIIFSSRLFVQDNSSGTPVLYPPVLPQDDLSKIRVVPNPYNISDPLVSGSTYGVDTQGRLIYFLNLPAVCTIKIFTENGDLVKTIDHTSPGGPSGSAQWNLDTSSGQLVSSGIYVAVFQTPNGGTSYQKFVIVR